MQRRTDAMRRMILLVAMTLATPVLLAQPAADVHVVPLGQGRTVDLRSIKPNTPVAATADDPKEIVTWDNGVSYSYDPSANIRQIGNDKFVYDHVQRLIQATVNGVERNYEYDLYGNRRKCRQDVGTAMEADCQSYSIDSGSNHIIGATYDPNGTGNVIVLGTHTYTYDAFNMMVRGQAGEAQEFIYTANDERIATYGTGSRTWRWTVRDDRNKVLREFTSSGGTNGTASFQWAKDFIWRDGLLLATLQQEGVATTTYHYHLDHLGTPRRITDSNDRRVGFHDYFAFGPEKEGKPEPSFTRIRHTGHERDVAGDLFGTLDYMHARYYNPELGRFLSVDPALDLKKTIPNPQKWNRYSYVRNSPINAIDPDGRDDLFIGDDFRDPFPAARAHRAYISNEQASVGISFIPGYGDAYDAISAIRGRDLLTGEKLGTFARIAGVLLPFVGVGALNKATDIFRGGDSLVAKATDVKIKDGLVQTTHGLSVNTVADTVQKHGGAYRVTSMPDGLKVIQRGTTDPNHYEIVPVKPMKMEDYQKLLSQVRLERVE